MNPHTTYRWRRSRLAMFGTIALSLIAVAACKTPDAGASSSDAEYPQRPVQIIVGFNAGGALDLVAREVATLFAADEGRR